MHLMISKRQKDESTQNKTWLEQGLGLSSLVMSGWRVTSNMMIVISSRLRQIKIS